MRSTLNFIAGERRPAASGATLPNVNPATGEVLGTVAASDARDVQDAVSAALRAFPAWRETPASERGAILLRIADGLEKNLDAFARAESRDTGKPVWLARSSDMQRAIANFRFFGGQAQHAAGEWHETDAVLNGVRTRAVNYTLRKPRGVAGLIAPWNLPLYLLTWKIAPALATGNTIVAKPSELTPTTADMLCDIASEAGVPAGVLNVVHGEGKACGGAIVSHPDVPTISFTGSTAVGSWIGGEAGRAFKRVSLELGGKNPFIVFEDADLDDALSTAVRAGFANQGQICLCGSRVLVQRAIFDRFAAGLVERAGKLVIGDPLDEKTTFGSLVGEAHLAKVAGMVDKARALGGKIHCGGGRVPKSSLPPRCANGAFYAPTVITGLDPACEIEQEEIFGPVVTLRPFETEDEAIALANGTRYGLAASLFTRDVSRAHRVAARIEAGLVWVNCWMIRDLRTPFGGVKHSGLGREGGWEAMKFFTEPTNVCVKI